mmetsp:Transcript_34646/g.48022  ORF Transcript_34646/g.48022 Transcript_34646/m.48022 type:complete len:603 (+) Transcript_34646:280-2088(+)|eukprot:CAMPEP_0196572812 /NCGR_PEP_ID=MMETSP1081-20130531/2794_1 /TAXON_ID=36882 /ORGANISM="Pyramimonas amylifera, Strain CCMP720" /LENGTH=602 /DNA_ID=CAMNT_0041890261 /DNA_START=187 /DNA_END=1995 /DNA_ORIENTATION=-
MPKDNAVAREPSTTRARGKTVVFKNVKYSVDIPKSSEKKEILKGITGVFKKGETTALMGPSGGGKTSLMDIIAGRKTTGNIEGDIYLGGVKPKKSQLRHQMGYVEQFDTLVATLTVKEMLLYTAELKRPQVETLASKTSIVDHILKELGLTNAADTKIGDAMMRGISGGQAKRVNIGLGLVTQPPVLMLDEPTSGLDSATCEDVMEVVHSLAKHGRCVVCTVHSPSSTVFRQFDRLFLLVLGECVFFGDPHTQAVPHFEGCGFPFKVGDSVADYCMFITGGGTKGTSGYNFAEAYFKSKMCSETANLADLELAQSSSEDVEDTDEDIRPALSVRRVLHELRVLLQYRAISNYKDVQYVMMRLGDKILFAFILTTLYWNEADEATRVSQNNIVALMFMVVVLPSYGATAYVPTLVLERPLFFREINDGCYYVISYLFSKLIEEAMVSAPFSALFITAIYFGIAMKGSFLLILVCFYLCLQCGITLAYAIGSVAPSMEAANALLPTYITVGLFFIGYFITFPSMPISWRWYSYLVHMRYGWTAMVINAFEDDDQIFADEKTVLEFYDIDDAGSKWENVGYLACFYVVFVTLGYIGLSKLSFVSR